jgi:hypothetical protein
MSDYKDAKPENYMRGLLVPRDREDGTFDRVRLYEYVEIGHVFRNHLEGKPDFLYAVNKNVIISTIGSQRVIVTEDGRLGIGESEPKRGALLMMNLIAKNRAQFIMGRSLMTAI